MGVMDTLNWLLENNLDKVPRIERFCLCLEVGPGVRACSLVLAACWLLYLVPAGLSLAIGWMLLAALWALATAACLAAVVFGMDRDRRDLLLPGLAITVTNVFVCALTAVINFFMGLIFG